MTGWEELNQLVDLLVVLLIGLFTARVWPSETDERLRLLLPLTPLAALAFVVGDALTISPPGPAWATVGIDLQYLGALLGPMSWVLIAGRLGAPGRLARTVSRSRALLIAVPALLYAGVLTNPWHGGFIGLTLGGRNEYRTWWFVIYAWILFQVVLSIWLFAATVRTRASSRRGGALLIVAPLLCFVGSFVYTASPSELPMDPSVVGWGVGAILLLYGVERLGIFRSARSLARTVLGASSLPLIWIGGWGEIVWSNDAAARLVGRPERRTLPELLAEEATVDSESWSAERWQSELDDAALAERLAVRFASSPESEFRLRCLPLRRAETQGLLVELEDVTTLLRRERELAARAREVVDLVEELPLGVLVCDARGMVVYLNRAVAALASPPGRELSSDEARARLAAVSVFSIPSWQQSGATEIFKRTLAHGQAMSTTLTHVSLWGRTMQVRVHTAPVRLPDGAAGVAALIEDRSALEASERAVVELRESVRHTQRFHALGTVAAGVAHDFRNLLTTVRGHAEIVRSMIAQGERPPLEELASHLQSVIGASDLGADLVRQILVFSGKAPQTRAELDLEHLFDELEGLLRTAVGRRIGLELRVHPGTPSLLADRIQLRQVLLNLSLNAAEAYGEASGVVRLEALPGGPEVGPAGQEHSPAEFVEIRVADGGSGMDDETVSRIWDPGFSTKAEGRGLGLSTVFGIVQAHGGTVDVASRVDEGTTIRILLPVAPPPAQPGAST